MTPIITVLPTVVGNYSAVITATTLTSLGKILAGLSRSATINDTFTLYGTADANVVSSVGCKELGGMVGGDSSATSASIFYVDPFPYYIVKRVAGSTACNLILSADLASGGGSGGGSTANLTALLLSDLAAGGALGAASATVDLYGAIALAQTTAGQTVYPPSPTSTTADSFLDLSNTGSTSVTVATSVAATTSMVLQAGTSVRMLWNGSAWTFEGNAIRIGGQAIGGNLVIGTTDNQTFGVVANGVPSFSIAGGGNVTLGQTGGATSSLLRSGTGGLTATTSTTGEVIVNSGTTGVVNLGTGSVGVDASAKTINVGTGAAVKTVNLGSTNTTSITTIAAGSPGIVHSGASVHTTPASIADGTGSLGTAAATVDVASVLNVNQTTPVITYANMRLIQPPTTTTAGRKVTICNVGTAAFTVGDATQKQGVNLQPGTTPGGAASANKGQAATFTWNGTAWVPDDAGPGDPVQAANLADGAANIPRIGRFTQYTLPAATLGAARILTTTLTGALIGDQVLVTRLDATANTLTINNSVGAALCVLPASKVGHALLRYNGTDFVVLSCSPN